MEFRPSVYESEPAWDMIAEYLGFGTPASAAEGTQQHFCIKDPVFIAIGTSFNHRGITQLGISRFDPRTLAQPGLANLISNEYPIVSALNLTPIYDEPRTSSPTNDDTQSPSASEQDQRSSLRKVQSSLRQILTPLDANGGPRDVILVGHSVVMDIATIEHTYHLDISSFPAVKAIMDTQLIAHRVLNPEYHPSLRDLLLMLGLDHVRLHVPAYDSRYTLQALLAMAFLANRNSGESIHILNQARLHLVNQIALFSQRKNAGPDLCKDTPRMDLEDD